MKWRMLVAFVVLGVGTIPGTFGQTQKPLTNADIINLAKQDLDSALIVKGIQSSPTSFDTTHFFWMMT